MEDPAHTLLRREANLIASRQPQIADEEKNTDLKQYASNGNSIHDGVVTAKSRGVFDMEMLASRLNVKYKIALYTSFTLLAYTLSLDQSTNRTYLTTATSVAFSAHSTLATVTTLRSVFQAVSQPPIAKLSDVAGRVEAYVVCVVLYTIGYIIVAASTSIYIYAAGNSIYILGITGLFLLQNIIISDISSLRDRVLFTIMPSVPSAINTWVGGDVAAALLDKNLDNWRWGYGMFCILTPVLAVPIISTLSIAMRVRKTDADYVLPPSRRQDTWKRTLVGYFWQLDLVGLLLFVGGAAMVLVTITLANSRTARWNDAHSIALLIVGFLCCISFVAWERNFAKHPLIPFKLLTSRTVVCCLLIALFHPMAGGIVGGYFYTFLLVAANQSVKSATRLNFLPSFAGTIVAIIGSFAIRYTRRLKPFIIFGFSVQTLGIGLMIRFRQSTNTTAEIAAVQCLRGFGVGLIGFPVQAMIQSASKHEHLAAITAGYLVVYYLSSGIGSSIGGGLWTNLVPGKIDAYMGDSALAAAAYANPIGFIAKYAPGTAPRAALAMAQDEVQRIIVSVGCAISGLALLSSLFLSNPKLPDTQSLADAEKDETASLDSEATKKDEKKALKMPKG